MNNLPTYNQGNPVTGIVNFLATGSNIKGETDMDIKNILFALIALFVLAPGAVIAAPQVSIDTVAEKEIIETVNGKQVKKRVAAKSADPGENLIFTLNYTNKGNEKAVNVKIDNPIPKETTYVVGSGIGKNSKMLFSIDGGKTYNAPSLLKYTVTLNDGKKIKKQASPDQYTNVRWVINEIPPGQSGKVGFQVKVK
jgi:uncharacterized repeat protein (TIGR01451 family)